MQEQTGRLSFDNIMAYTGAREGGALTPSELREIFDECDLNKDNFISMDEFLVFFGRVSRKMNNKEFEELIMQMSG